MLARGRALQRLVKHPGPASVGVLASASVPIEQPAPPRRFSKRAILFADGGNAVRTDRDGRPRKSFPLPTGLDERCNIVQANPQLRAPEVEAVVLTYLLGIDLDPLCIVAIEATKAAKNFTAVAAGSVDRTDPQDDPVRI